MRGAWIAVACAEHVRRGQAGGFMQVCHGKAAPLRRVQPGDGVAYYSPTVALGSKVPYRAFTAAGIVEGTEPYLFDMGKGFQPWRRDVRWQWAGELPAIKVVGSLSFAAGQRNWAYGLRFGLKPIPPEDFDLLLEAMQAHLGGERESGFHPSQPLSVVLTILRAARDSTMRSWTKPRISTAPSAAKR